MSNPVTVEVTRGNRVESRHRGLIAVVDADGGLVWSAGDEEAAVFPRSACKAIQALPLVESGAADAYGFTDRELALACSSHNGEDGHVETAAAMLARAGRDGETLECGAHWSFDQATLIHQARTLGKPTALHNNCSGKHAGFVCACCHQGIEPTGYVTYEHELQRQIRAAMEDVTGSLLGTDNCGVDGCSIPTYAVPLKGLAQGFAKLATGTGLAPERAKAGRRLVEACMVEPWYVAGTRRACTRLMEIAPGRIFVKTGAEGVFCAAIPELGLGIALKCEDGTTRAAEAMIGAVLARFFREDDEVHALLTGFAKHSMRNWNGMHVGDVRVTDALFT